MSNIFIHTFDFSQVDKDIEISEKMILKDVRYLLCYLEVILSCTGIKLTVYDSNFFSATHAFSRYIIWYTRA